MSESDGEQKKNRKENNKSKLLELKKDPSNRKIDSSLFGSDCKLN